MAKDISYGAMLCEIRDILSEHMIEICDAVGAAGQRRTQRELDEAALRKSLDAQLRDTRARYHALLGKGWPRFYVDEHGVTSIHDVPPKRRLKLRVWKPGRVKAGRLARRKAR